MQAQAKAAALLGTVLPRLLVLGACVVSGTLNSQSPCFPFSMSRAECPTPVLSLWVSLLRGAFIVSPPSSHRAWCSSHPCFGANASCQLVGPFRGSASCSVLLWLWGVIWEMLACFWLFLSVLTVYRATVMDARCIYPAATKGHCPHCCWDVPGGYQRGVFLPWQWGIEGEKGSPASQAGGLFLQHALTHMGQNSRL